MGGRSPDFERYLAGLSPSERAAILKAEREYLDSFNRKHWSLRDVADQQQRGYEETPAGQRPKSES